MASMDDLDCNKGGEHRAVLNQVRYVCVQVHWAAFTRSSSSTQTIRTYYRMKGIPPSRRPLGTEQDYLFRTRSVKHKNVRETYISFRRVDRNPAKPASV